VQQRRLAAARGTDDGDELAALHVDVDAAQRIDLDLAHVIDHPQVDGLEDRLAHDLPTSMTL
jgi:hypothetical protein